MDQHQNPTPAPAPQPAAAAVPHYYSNPFEIIWEGFMRLGVNIGPLFGILGLAIATILAFVPAFIVGMLAHNNNVMNIIAIVLGVAALVVMVVIGIRLVGAGFLLYLADARRQKIGTMELYHRAKPGLSWRIFWVNCLYLLVILGGLLLLIVPGFLFAYWFSLAPYILADQNCGVIESMKRSRNLVRGHGWEMWGMYCASQVMAMLEYIPFFGNLIAFILSWAMGTGTALRYIQLEELTKSGEPKPPVNAWNYFAVFFGPALLTLILVVVIIGVVLSPPSNR